MALHFVKKQKQARKELEALVSDSANVQLIHYANAGLLDPNGPGSPRVAVIAVRNLKSGQTRSFSAHLVAEELNRPLEEFFGEDRSIEKQLLKDFFDYAREKQDCWWVHWNMRDSVYGFPALEHRYKVLGGEPFYIPSARKTDISRLLVDLYGPDYVTHGRMEKLMEKNNIDRYTFLSGKEEAECLATRDVARVHQSVLRKVSIFEHFVEFAHDRRLKTDASWWDQHGGSVRAAVDWLIGHPWMSFGLALLGVVLGVLGLSNLGS